MRRLLLLAGTLFLAAAPSVAAKPTAGCSGSLVWRGAGTYALKVHCSHVVGHVTLTPNAPLALSSVQARSCSRASARSFTCAAVRTLVTRVTTPQDQACALRLSLTGAGMRPLSVVAAGCPVVLHFRVDYAGKASGIESADVMSTWTSSITWAVHFGDLGLSLPTPTVAESATRTVDGTWHFNSDGCAGSVVDLDQTPARVYANADPVTGTYRLLIEPAIHLGTGALTSPGTSPLPCREWDGDPIDPRGTTTYPAGKRVSYTASLQAIVSVKYATLTNVSVGHTFVATLQGPDASLRPTSFTGPQVSWIGQVVLTRTR